VALAPSVAVPARRPVMQPMPAPPAPPGRAPTPRGSPQTWITNDDYPAPALRAAMSGPVAFRLDVDATGMPVRCTVTLSSGYDLLDNTTCSLMMRRARFNPAMGSGGRAIAGAWTSRMRWALPAGNPGSGSAEPGTWTRTLRFTIAADGAISNCLEELGRTRVERPSGGCAALAYSDPEATKEWRGSARGPVTIVIRQTQIEVGTPGLTPAALPDGLKTVMSQRASFEIGDAGLPVACSGVIDVLVLPVRALGCWPGMRYPRSSARQSVIVTQVVLTTGDERVGAAMKVTEN